MKSFFSLLTCLVFASAVLLTAVEPVPAGKSDFHGVPLHTVTLEKQTVLILVPEHPAEGRPWLLAGSLYNLESPVVGNMTRVELELVKRGFHVVAFGLGNTFGAPDALAKWDAVYALVRERYGLSDRVSLLGVSREGLPIARWAAAHPGRVTALYMDKAVCDFKSWPGGKLGIGKGSARDWASLIPLYHFQSEAEALAYTENPVDLASKLAADRVGILYVTGETDDAVPYAENGARMEEVYRKVGAPFELIRRVGEGHHPHGVSDPTPVVEFLVKQTEAKR